MSFWNFFRLQTVVKTWKDKYKTDMYSYLCVQYVHSTKEPNKEVNELCIISYQQSHKM